ncbi:MAG: alpha-L-fucosidase [Planctomycetales bacterium]|nr:alpha-L-fucosidase [Planctomycetales bacterium]
MRQWQDRRFGLFIHWGPVSLTGKEIGWARGQEIPIEEYDQLYKKFNPTRFDADQWAQVASDTGVKYVVLTTKHHDGFCLWDTRQTDYNIMNASFGRDVVKELAAACRKKGIAFGTYYSTCDWHHPDFPLTSPGGSVRRETHNLNRYTDYLKAQVKELLVNYGPLSVLWFDVPQEFDTARGQALIDFVRAVQPDIIINNRTGAEGDYSTPEQRIGGFDRQRPWETCMTLCRQWAWKPEDAMKPLKECIRTLLYTVGGDGNLLFNVGPMPDGRIEPRQVERLQEMGRWVKRYGDGIYGTRGGPFLPGPWGASTCRDDKIYLYVMNWPENGSLRLPVPMKDITGAKVLSGGSVDIRQTDEGVAINVPEKNRDEIATVIELTVAAKAFEIRPCSICISQSAAFGKNATASDVYRNSDEYTPARALDDDPDTRWATNASVTSAWLQIDLGSEKTIGGAMIDEHDWNRIKKFELQYMDDLKWKTAYAGTAVGSQRRITFQPVRAQLFRLSILDSSDGPTIWEVHLFEENHKP